MRKIIHLFGLIISLILFATTLQAQEIKGRIIDVESGKPIAGASIYLNGTYKGTASDSKGNFALYNDQKNIPLIISYVGYETQTVADYAGKELTIRLKAKINELREVTIGYDGLGRDAEMKIFLTEFLGGVSKDCFISNPDEISFTYNNKSKLLIAKADQPLIIVNKKLGYKINYFLSLFKYMPGALVFQGNYFFAEDTAGIKAKEIKKILKARNEAYYGSRMHFIRSLWADNLKSDGFEMYNNYSLPVRYNDIILAEDDKKYLSFSTQINVIYRKDHFLVLKPIDIGKGILISDNGFFDPLIYWGGDMGTKRINELLPFEFQPSR